MVKEQGLEQRRTSGKEQESSRRGKRKDKGGQRLKIKDKEK